MTKRIVLDETFKGHPRHEDFGKVFVRIYKNMETTGYPFSVGFSHAGSEEEIFHGFWDLRNAVQFADDIIARWKA